MGSAANARTDNERRQTEKDLVPSTFPRVVWRNDWLGRLGRQRQPGRRKQNLLRMPKRQPKLKLRLPGHSALKLSNVMLTLMVYLKLNL